MRLMNKKRDRSNYTDNNRSVNMGIVRVEFSTAADYHS